MNPASAPHGSLPPRLAANGLAFSFLHAVPNARELRRYEPVKERAGASAISLRGLTAVATQRNPARTQLTAPRSFAVAGGQPKPRTDAAGVKMRGLDSPVQGRPAWRAHLNSKSDHASTSFLIVRCSSPAQGAVLNRDVESHVSGRLHPFRRILAAILLSLMASTPATAHEFYAPECCNDKDCAPLPADAVSATPKGWLVKPTGEVVPYQSHKLRSAPDGQFHGCFVGGDASKTMLCLYVPPQGF